MPSRNAANFLKGFTGWLQADGYQGYHCLPESIHAVGCRAHARRKFDEALQVLPKESCKGSQSAIGECCCTELFRMEKELAELLLEERHKQRLGQEKPVWDASFACANELYGKAVA